MANEVIATLDQSTSGTKLVLVDNNGRVVGKWFKKHEQIYPRPGWIEHNPQEIVANCEELLRKALGYCQLVGDMVKVLSLTNQRETVVVWEKKSGNPVYNAIVWQCRRTADLCSTLSEDGYESIVQEKTGLRLDPYFSATKVHWILNHVEGAQEKARQGELLMGTIDSWLIWKLTGGQVHATDYTNASRTLLFNIYTQKWDRDLLQIFDIPEPMLPEVRSSNEVFGYIADQNVTSKTVPLAGVIGDSQGALFGQKCFDPGDVKATYGTGSSVLMHIGETPIRGKDGIVTSLAWGIDGRVEYALEGIIITTGDTLKWVGENLGLFSDFMEAEQMAVSLKGNDGVYFVPAFAGLGAPYWDPYARAAILGIDRSTTKAHVVRAAIESIAYQVKDVLDIMEEVSGIHVKQFRADGGATANQFLMQFQADLLGTEVISSRVAELSAMGSAYLAGLALGIWRSKEEIRSLDEQRSMVRPGQNRANSLRLYEGWKRAVMSVLSCCEN